MGSREVESVRGRADIRGSGPGARERTGSALPSARHLPFAWRRGLRASAQSPATRLTHAAPSPLPGRVSAPDAAFPWPDRPLRLLVHAQAQDSLELPSPHRGAVQDPDPAADGAAWHVSWHPRWICAALIVPQLLQPALLRRQEVPFWSAPTSVAEAVLPAGLIALGTGWPSFFEGQGVKERIDWRLFEDGRYMGLRREVVCARCGSHLGHVFRGENWATPTGVRYCINSSSMKVDVQEPGPCPPAAKP